MSIGNIKDYTPNFKFIIPSFDIATWHDYIEENFRNIDALFYNLFGINNYSGTWKNITSYTVGQVLFVGEDKDLEGNDTDYAGRLVKVLVDHTTDNSDYFNIYYNLHPKYYELFADASTAQYYAQIAQQNADLTINLKQDVENFLLETTNLYNRTQDLRNDALSFRNDAENFSKNAQTSSNNAQVSAKNAQDYLNLTQETYYSAINDINATKSDAIIQIDQNTNQKIDEFISLSNKNTQTTTNLLNQTQIAAQNAQNYANEAWGKISNVGDIFYSLRLDDELNGAVVCNGNFYELEDFTGTHSIKNLLEQNKLPYVSLEEYENTLNTYGSVRCFGYTPYSKACMKIATTMGSDAGYIYRSPENDTIINEKQMTAWLKDGQIVYTLIPEDQIPAYLLLQNVGVYNKNMGTIYVGTEYSPEQGSNQFRVPTLDDVYIKAGIANLPNEFNVESLPNITGDFHHMDLYSGTAAAYGAFSTAVGSTQSYVGATQSSRTTASWTFDASRSSSTYKNNAKVNPDNVRYRAFVQLANAATENAVISATSAISQLADASYKSKDETITGLKIFEQKITSKGNFYRQISFPYTDTPTETSYVGYAIKDSNNNTFAGVDGVLYASGTNCTQMYIRGKSGTLSRMYVQETNDGKVTYNYGQTAGTKWIKIPKGSGTAVLICWGNISASAMATTKTITYPTAFSETPRIATTSNGGSAQVYQNVIKDGSATSFTVISSGGSASQGFHWIAVGNATL